MKISKRDKSLLLVVGGLSIVLATYYFVFLNLQEKTEALEAENLVLEDVIGKLKELDKNREQYLSDTERYVEDSERIKAEFPAGMEEEDDILYIDGLEGTLSEFYASSVGMPSSVGYELAYPKVETISVDEMLQGTNTTNTTADTTVATTTDAGEADSTADAVGATTDGATLTADSIYPSCQLWYVPVTTTYEANYLYLKQLVKAITDDEDKKSVEDVSITYNEENGILSGTITSNFYYLSGTDEVYTTPDVAGVPVGTSNPFRSVR
jgi:hypothetical protein